MSEEGIAWRYALVAVFVVGMLVASISYNTTIIKPDDSIITEESEREWQTVWEGRLGEADPGSGQSGILCILFYPNTADANNTYNENDTATLNASAYAYTQVDDFVSEVPHNTAFDIVVRIRANKTHAWETDKFIDGFVRVRITSSDLSIGADTEMDREVTWNQTTGDYIYINFYINNSESGYQIARNNESDITSIKLEAYY